MAIPRCSIQAYVPVEQFDYIQSLIKDGHYGSNISQVIRRIITEKMENEKQLENDINKMAIEE